MQWLCVQFRVAPSNSSYAAAEHDAVINSLIRAINNNIDLKVSQSWNAAQPVAVLFATPTCSNDLARGAAIPQYKML
jgi:hypothetical protein